MKFFVLFFLFIFPLTGFSQKKDSSSSDYGLYIGGGYSTVADSGTGSEMLTGPAYGAVLGYRWVSWGLELGYSKFDLASEPGVANPIFGAPQIRIDKAELKANSFDIILKYYFWRFFTLGLGYSKVSGKHDFRFSSLSDPTDIYIVKGESDYTGAIIQAGIVLPLFRFLDFRFLYEARGWSNDEEWDSDAPVSEPLGGSFQQFTGQIIYYFN